MLQSWWPRRLVKRCPSGKNGRMASEELAGSAWKQGEIDLIVADYFDMLYMELRGERYVKAQRNAALQDLTGRSRGSIERKHQNISAVLKELCEPWIPGYKPLANYQAALADAIERVFDSRPPWLSMPLTPQVVSVSEGPPLFIEEPPQLVTRPEELPEVIRRLVRKFDPAARDARNRALGRQGEEIVLRSEHARLSAAGRGDLARKVDWISERLGDGAGYDILSFDVAGNERLLEVKTTSGHRTTPFFLTENERTVSEERPQAFRLVRLYDAHREPRAFELAPPLSDCLLLRPTVYRASFGRGEPAPDGQLST